MSWHADAACLGAEGQFLIEDQRSAEGRAQIERCKAICAGCPVIVQCREWIGLTHWPCDEHVVAGMSPTQVRTYRNRPELRAERKSLAVYRCGTERAYLEHVRRGQTCSICSMRHNQRCAATKSLRKEAARAS